MPEIIQTHRQLVLLVDIKNGNPQGDPDDENRPRTDPETGRGIITAQGPKRKIRDWFAMNGQEVYVSRGACLQRVNRAISDSIGIPDVFGQEEDDEEESDEADEKPAKGAKKTKKPAAKKVKATPEMSQQIYSELTRKYIDARLFGQLIPRLTGTMRGPVQFSMGESIDAVQPTRHAITRVAVATEAEEKSQGGANRGMGGLWYIPYGLYRFHIYVNPADAKRTGCTEEDYELLLRAIMSMFDNDRSSVRTASCVRALYEFKQKKVMHGRVLGEQVLEAIKVRRKNNELPARSFDDYTVHVPEALTTSSDFEFRRVVSEVSPWADRDDLAAE